MAYFAQNVTIYFHWSVDLNDTVMEDMSKTEQDSAPLLAADNSDNDPNDVKVIGGGGGNFDIHYYNFI